MPWPVNPVEGKSPTGEPYAGNPHVRFGGGSGRATGCSYPYTTRNQVPSSQLEIIVKKGEKIRAVKVTKTQAKGSGERLGTAYRLQDGTMVYVPE